MVLINVRENQKTQEDLHSPIIFFQQYSPGLISSLAVPVIFNVPCLFYAFEFRSTSRNLQVGESVP